jgi:hypothetical protein
MVLIGKPNGIPNCDKFRLSPTRYKKYDGMDENDEYDNEALSHR